MIPYNEFWIEIIFNSTNRMNYFNEYNSILWKTLAHAMAEDLELLFLSGIGNKASYGGGLSSTGFFWLLISSVEWTGADGLLKHCKRTKSY